MKAKKRKVDEYNRTFTQGTNRHATIVFDPELIGAFIVPGSESAFITATHYSNSPLETIKAWISDLASSVK